ncbi:MAG: hypothetical protein LLG04_14035 [Parachlamydia sp.]|nr:hypothetical protein [Parachlamydia sp.]
MTSISSKKSSLLLAPAEYLEKGGQKIVYAFKQGLHSVETLTGIPSPLGSVIRKITESVGPSLAFFGSKQQWQEVAKPFVGLVEAIDILELIGDANYFLNGGFAEDRAKKRYFSIAAMAVLTPADIITIVFYAKDAFKVSFKALSSFAATVGRIPVFGLVTRLSLVTVARILATAGFAFMAIDATYRKAKYQKKMEAYAKRLSDRNIRVKPGDKDLRELFQKANVVERDQKEALGRDFVKYRNNCIKIKQAKLDFYAMCSEIAIKVAVLGGLAAGATLVGSLALASLGAIAFGLVGYRLYYKLTTHKPALASVI